MTLEELLKRKKELGYTYADIAEKSGIPLPTVQKIFGGSTKSPRYATLRAIEEVLAEASEGKKKGIYDAGLPAAWMVRETSAPYGSPGSGTEAVKYADSYPLLPHKRQGEYTAEDRDMLPEDVRTELIDGVLYDMASPLNPHQIVVGELFSLLRECIAEKKKDCYVFLAPSDVWLTGDNKNIFQPDLYMICDFSMLGKNGHTKGAPPFVIEVLSKSTRSKDFLLKTYKYCNAGVKEYWLVDPEKRKVWVCDFVKDPEGVERTEYSFEDRVPIAISGGECSIDFARIAATLARLGYE